MHPRRTAPPMQQAEEEGQPHSSLLHCLNFGCALCHHRVSPLGGGVLEHSLGGCVLEHHTGFIRVLNEQELGPAQHNPARPRFVCFMQSESLPTHYLAGPLQLLYSGRGRLPYVDT